MLKYIIGWEGMKEEKWWFSLVHSIKNACPWVVFLDDQVTIIAEYMWPVLISPQSLSCSLFMPGEDNNAFS